MSERLTSSLSKVVPRREILKNIGKVVVASGVGALTNPYEGSLFGDFISIFDYYKPLPRQYQSPETSMLCEATEDIFVVVKDRYGLNQIEVMFTDDGLPIKCRLEDGCVVLFDQEAVKMAREKAIVSEEPEIIDVILTPQKPEADNDIEPKYFSKSKPLRESLPDDVLSEAELAQKGIKIIQSDNTELYIRKQAFEKGNLLEDFTGGGRKLTIVLVNGSVISPNLLKDTKYEGIRDTLHRREVDIESFKAYLIGLNLDVVDLEREYLKKVKSGGSRDEYDDQIHHDVISSLKAEIFEYENLWTDDRILVELVAQNTGEAAGYYIRRTNKDEVIFVAVGENAPDPKRIRLYFDQEGKFQIADGKSYTAGRGFTPTLGQNFPSPEEFRRNMDASRDKKRSYPYGAQKIGQVLRHELAHRKTLNEYDADMTAMDTISQAWATWKDSGYKDDGGYYFVFRLPEGYPFRGYIFTQVMNKSSTQM
ncbi:hypothetical protein A2870_03540 [Candidatus Curtissbacteria bacterium RIFCSPHIGHO2_01_FULL_41_11]|uniref:Uncharacterized protein n=1 Tax=Candidatus Curtissbacteria bacterium RIFCSPHIGHO2_01_FULL_41_11 TaxID=1797711 RepID=A0A1F5G5V3_9BACT|nr:MAG: hypothetical protein A2870_03540 [Candidatus Curtissbacteria bacterium RIFCSPHIGHO2_01_FULL_41_11]